MGAGHILAVAVFLAILVWVCVSSAEPFPAGAWGRPESDGTGPIVDVDFGWVVQDRTRA